MRSGEDVRSQLGMGTAGAKIQCRRLLDVGPQQSAESGSIIVSIRLLKRMQIPAKGLSSSSLQGSLP